MIWSDLRKIKIVMEHVDGVPLHIDHTPHHVMRLDHGQIPYVAQMQMQQSRQHVPLDIQQTRFPEPSPINTGRRRHVDEPKTDARDIETNLPRQDVEEPKRRRILPPKSHSLKFESRSPQTEMSQDTTSEVMKKELEDELRELDLDGELGDLDDEVAEMVQKTAMDTIQEEHDEADKEAQAI